MFLIDLFVTFIYQPFFNILVFIYWLLGLVTQGRPDMGMAVIILTIFIRILLLPLSLASDKSEKERREIVEKLKELEEIYATDPITFRQKKNQLIHGNRKVFVAEFISLAIQVAISLMLYQIFKTGLKGADTYLLYPFMPDVAQPYNLDFLGTIHLDETNVMLNLIQSLCIFVLETLAIATSPYPPSKGEVVRLQLILPVVSFVVFMFFPAGKKLFVITTLIFSIILTLYKFIKHKFEAYRLKVEEREAAEAAGEEKVVVEVK